MAIKILEEHVAARIAAGEVVERPASVVKELIENAIDADANLIDIVVRGGQLEQIKVTDDGIGMDPTDLALALHRHATSKLIGDDIGNVVTLGYRGEALPSIAAVAEINVVSRTKAMDCAFIVTSESGQISKPKPSAGRKGTVVEVYDLFSRHPARQKFQKSAKTEAAVIREIIASAALAHPDIEFRFAINGSQGRFPSRKALKDRLSDVLGTGFSKDSVEVSFLDGEISIHGFACIPSATRADVSGIKVSVNGRPVTDRLLRTAVQSAYSALIGEGRHPQVYIDLNVPSQMVDINVHPRKAEVRFSRPAEISSLITNAVTAALDTSGFMTPSNLPDLAKRLSHAALELSQVDDTKRLPLGKFVHQVNGSWLIAENSQGIVIIDQHAAHERVILERLKKCMDDIAEEIATLPTPVMAHVDFLDAAAVNDCLETIRSVGFWMTATDDTVILTRIPAVLSDCSPEGLIELIVECAREGVEGGLLRQAIWDKLANSACKAAIKAGQVLDPERANLLLREIEATPNASYCNHGRPTTLFFKEEDLASLFGR